ncbi:MAG TPA: PKD domain-containing protein [Acidimicrobiales bacterium]|nr:PKD domain-containing protein [Acidimicrobiales bacterium]
MRIRRRFAAAGLCLLTAATASGAAGAHAGADPVPRAEISIEPGATALSVMFVAGDTGFPGGVANYKWSFGDGTSSSTSGTSLAHTYQRSGQFDVRLTEMGKWGSMAKAYGTVRLFDCPAGMATCTEQLTNIGSVNLLQASGPIGQGQATVDLFVGPYQVPACEPQVGTAVGITDTGFTGNLTATVEYVTSHPKQVQTTCFDSTVPFVDAFGQTVNSGPLPNCGPFGSPPCLKSFDITGSVVTKVLLIPPGDPKVGAP